MCLRRVLIASLAKRLSSAKYRADRMLSRRCAVSESRYSAWQRLQVGISSSAGSGGAAILLHRMVPPGLLRGQTVFPPQRRHFLVSGATVGPAASSPAGEAASLAAWGWASVPLLAITLAMRERLSSSLPRRPASSCACSAIHRSSSACQVSSFSAASRKSVWTPGRRYAVGLGGEHYYELGGGACCRSSGDYVTSTNDSANPGSRCRRFFGWHTRGTGAAPTRDAGRRTALGPGRRRPPIRRRQHHSHLRRPRPRLATGVHALACREARRMQCARNSQSGTSAGKIEP